MILKHKTGVLLHGAIVKDPVFKDVGQKRVMKFDVKAHSVKNDAGSWECTYVRVNLSVIADGLMTADELTDALVASAKEVTEEDIERWKAEWKEIAAIIAKNYPDLSGLDDDRARIEEMLASGQYACHHSAAYNAAYHPHYRIIAKDIIPALREN